MAQTDWGMPLLCRNRKTYNHFLPAVSLLTRIDPTESAVLRFERSWKTSRSRYSMSRPRSQPSQSRLHSCLCTRYGSRGKNIRTHYSVWHCSTSGRILMWYRARLTGRESGIVNWRSCPDHHAFPIIDTPRRTRSQWAPSSGVDDWSVTSNEHVCRASQVNRRT